MKNLTLYKVSRVISRISLHTFLLIGGLLMIFPFIWMILSSFKPSLDVVNVGFNIIPTTWTLSNYEKVLTELPLIRGYINSIIVSTAITLLVLFTASTAGYLFAKLRFRGRNILFMFVISSMMIPPQIAIIPLFYMVVEFKMINSYLGLIFPFAMSGFGIFLMKQFVGGIPDSLIDAARIDGSSDFQIYFRIIIPLIKSSFFVLGILTFIWSWDYFLWPLVVVMDNDMKTLPLILGHFTQAEGLYPGPSMAAVSIVTIPILIVYLFFQRFFVKGMSMTGLKG